ncbi:MAG: hypothetical protein OXG82_20860 [Gammaproteobacteria bacterium]|nr:hypothetical protein [Gammaproteobacteria bacterium]
MAILKWSGIVVAALILGLLALRLLYGVIANPRVMDEITTSPNGERAGIVMALTLPDGRTLPVNYRREGNQVYAGADGRWWRTLRDGDAPVTVLIRGETLTGHAHVVFDDPAFKADVFSRLRPTVPSWLPAWLDAHLVVIELDGSEPAPP